jgi:hypothetical protein
LKQLSGHMWRRQDVRQRPKDMDGDDSCAVLLKR